ncbi:MAG: CPBP family intramembrane metalloprotease [Propionibacteriales bacterium]|nr:CPBP family intramembrane metalloprotease [Propionibacteriales bacterium]
MPPYGQTPDPYGQTPGPYGPTYGPPAHGQPPPHAGGYPPGPPRPAPLPPYPHQWPEPYHRILRTWTYRPWRAIVGVLATVPLGVLVAPLLALVVVGLFLEVFGLGSMQGLVDAVAFEGEFTPAALLVVNLTLASLIPITWLTVRVLHNLRPRWLGSVRPGLRWGLFGQFFGLAMIATVLMTAVLAIVGPEEMTGDEGAGPTSTTRVVAFLIVIALTSPLQSAGEEYFFRGYLLQAFGALVRFRWFTLVATSLLFAFAHGLQNLPLFLDRFLFGMVAGLLVIRTGGLEAGIAMHIVNNVVVLGLAAVFGDLSATLSVTEADWTTLVLDIGQFAVYAGMVVALCRVRRTPRTTPGPPPDQPPPERASETPGPAG